MSIYHLDYETASKINIFDLGGYRYAEDPSTQILMFAIRKDDDDAILWDFTDGGEPALSLLAEAIDSNSLIYAHNAEFEHAVSSYKMAEQLGLHAPKIEQWRCTAAMCRRAGIPPSLKGAADFLRFDDGKDTKGKALIWLFSDMNKEYSLFAPKGAKAPGTNKRPENRKSFSPIMDEEILWDWEVTLAGEKVSIRDAWEMFKAYCLQDVRVEAKLHKHIAHFELSGPILESFQFNMRMNERGIPVNRETLAHAHKMVLKYQGHLGTQFENLTDLRFTQTAKFLLWIQDHGYHEENLQADTVARVLADNDMDKEGTLALTILSLLKFAALKKFPTMLAAACKDGRVRGTLMWHGARTGRAAGRIIQPHNMKKAPDWLDTDFAYQMITDGDPLEDFETFWSSPLEIIASCARHFIQDPEDHFLDADYTGVEARITPWLAGDEKKMASIMSGVDQYKAMATLVFHNDISEVTKAQRNVGKPMELSCCFGTGARGIKKSLTDKGHPITLKQGKEIVGAYRTNHPETVDAWKAIEEAVLAAIANKKTTTILDGKVKISRRAIGPKGGAIQFLIIQLPSGRELYYPGPMTKHVFKKYDKEEMLEEPWKAEAEGYHATEIRFYGQRENSKAWGWVATWGSRLFENIVQSIGADLLEAGCVEAEKRGFEIFAVVHDQALAPEKDGKTIEEFIDALCYKNPWAETFPLEADGSVAPYYRKD
tara:strand:+ start:8012 stop:10147 length:2136 start_codon:yes stop_codon:yes gene_type:complete